MARASLYRSDLLLTLAAGGQSIPMELAGQLCGFDYREPAPEQPEIMRVPPVAPTINEAPPVTVEPTAATTERLEFWYPASVEVKTQEEIEQLSQPPPEIRDAKPLTEQDFEYEDRPLPGKPLVHWSRLWPFLRTVLGRQKAGRRPDLPRLVRMLAEGRPLLRLPKVKRRAWRAEVHLLVDRREALAPFWDDYDHLIHRLKAMRGNAGLRIMQVVRDGDDLLEAGICSDKPLALPPSHAVVLALGDLGQYPGGFALDPWFRLGRQLRRRGISPWALCPCPRDRWSPRMARLWKIAAWDRGLRLPVRGDGQRAEPVPVDERQALEARRNRQLDDLFLLLSPAIRVERGLLRDARLLAPGEADAGTEYDAFQSRTTRGTGSGFSFLPDKIRELRARLCTISPTLLCQCVRLLMAHHLYCRQVFGLSELLGLREVLPPQHWQALISSGVLREKDHADARAYWQRLAASLSRESFGTRTGQVTAFAARDLDRLQGDARLPVEMQTVWALANPGPHRDLPPWINPAVIAWMGEKKEQTTEPVMLADGIVAGLEQGRVKLVNLASRSTSCVITLHPDVGPPERFERPWGLPTRVSPERLHGLVGVTLSSGLDTLHLAKMTRPEWASRLYYDANGLAADVEIQGRQHRLRWSLPWISFQMINGLALSTKTSGTTHGRWHAENKPSWATRLSVDAHGLAAEFRIGSVPFVLRWIPPGSFLRGSPEDEPGRYGDEGPQHQVTISQGFWMTDTPVTQAQWRAVVAAAGAQPALWKKLIGKQTLNPEPSHFKGDALPVEQVNWKDSALFCQLLNALLPDGPGFGLPTEANWEYACRAGTTAAFNDDSPCTEPEGKDPALDALGWFDKNSDGKTHPVKAKKPNAWGLYDMHGQVWEWCADAWSDYPSTPQTDPRVPGDDSAHRVMRGGSWGDLARSCRSACRGRGDPGYRWHFLGLRLAAGQNEPRAAEPPGAERPKSSSDRL